MPKGFAQKKIIKIMANCKLKNIFFKPFPILHLVNSQV